MYIHIIEIIITILLVVLSVSLFVIGYTCYHNPESQWVTNPQQCVSIYLSGIIISFITGLIIILEILYLILTYCDDPDLDNFDNSQLRTTIVTNPSPRSSPTLSSRPSQIKIPVLSSSPNLRPKSPLSKKVSKRALEIIVEH